MYEMVLHCPANVETIEFCDLVIDSLASFFAVRDRQAFVYPFMKQSLTRSKQFERNAINTMLLLPFRCVLQKTM
ncbi:hypothetical protein GCM10008982_14590 [Anoxybacillus voinovskiensis]|nr:hypothetical protein GCM10008982_14590 [Anoxybacillus voinovskiensis]